MSIAFLFPGQGSQHTDFLHQLPQHPIIAETLAEADRLLGRSVMDLDTEQALRSSAAVQLSLYVSGVAVARALMAERICPDAVAGLSVGAFAAAVICGSLKFHDGWALVKQRAEGMESLYPEGYGLAVIVGLSERQVAELLSIYHTPEAPVFMGNINAPQQIVIAGSLQGMDSVLEAARKKGVRRAERLPVSVPSHCSLLSPVARGLERTLATMELLPPVIPYISNRRARTLRSADPIRADLATNVEAPVRWHDATTVLVELGTKLFLEMPPAHVLTSLIQEAFPDVRSIAVEGTAIRYIQEEAKDVGSID